MEKDTRQAFWAPLRETEGYSNLGIAELEGRLCTQFGAKLRDGLIEYLSSSLQEIENRLHGGVRDFERFFFHFEPRMERGYQWGEAYSKFIDYRLQVWGDNPAVREAQSRMVEAAGMIFATRIVGYSSLTLDLSVGSLEHLAKAFDGNFESFRVFLDAFVPAAFAEVFTEEFAIQHQFDINAPSSLETQFQEGFAAMSSRLNAVEPRGGRRATAPSESGTRERAEWLWRLANGSLVIPVLLALAVMYFGLKQLGEIQVMQREALKPILQNQVELLKEERLRLAPPTPAATVQPSEQASPVPASK